MAQSVERRLGKAEVTGSIPVSSLNIYLHLSEVKVVGFFVFI